MQGRGRLWGVSRLKLAVMLPFVSFVLVLALGVSVLEYRQARRDSLRQAGELTAAIEGDFRASVHSETALLQAVAETIIPNDALAAALQAGDRHRLRMLASTLFASVRQTARITHLYFIDAQRRCVLRAHQPERFGDVIDRQSILTAEATHMPAFGIELGTMGTLTLRVVVPWYRNGHLIGYVETGKEIGDLFQSLRSQFAVQPVVMIPKSRLDRAAWEQGVAMLGRRGEWDEFDDVVTAVADGPSTQVVQALTRRPGEDVSQDGHWYRWLPLDIPDLAGAKLASLGVVVDVSRRHEEIFRFGAVLAAMVLTGSVLVIAVFGLVIGRVDARLGRAAAALAQRERLFHGLFSQADIAMLLVDPDGGAIVDANDRAVRDYGYDRDRLLSMTLAELAVPAVGEQDGGLQAHRRADGEIRQVEIHRSGIEVGGRSLIHAIIQDVTDRQRAEEARRASEERFRRLIEDTTDWVWETDDQHRLSWFSPSMSKVLGASEETALGRRRWDLASERHRIDPTRWTAHFADLDARRPFRDFRYWVHTGSGEARWVTISGTPRFDADGLFQGYRGSGSDITVHAGPALRLRTMSTVVEQSPVSVIITDFDGVVTYVNPHFTTATGFAESEVLGRDIRTFSSDGSDLDRHEEVRRVVLAGGSWSGEYRNRRADGSLCWERETVFPVTNDEGSLVHVVAIREDVTVRKQAEARLVEQMDLTQRHYENLRALSEIAAVSATSSGEQLAQALALGCRHLQLPLGILSRIDGADYTVLHHCAPPEADLSDGQVFALGDTYCAITLAQGDVVAIPHMAVSDHASHPCYRAFQLESYVGAPVMVRGRLFGTVNFSSTQPYVRDFDDGDLEFMRLLSRIMGAIVERADAEQEVQRALAGAEAARRRTDLLLTSAGDGFIGADAAGRVAFLNPAARRLLGFADGDDVIGVNIHDLTGHAGADGSACRGEQCGVLRTLADGVARHTEGDLYHRRDGSTFPVEMAITATTEHGVVTGGVVVFRDITRRLVGERALSDALQRIEGQAAELSRINAELEQFAYVASHDLRQPLRMVSSYLRLIEKTLGDTLDEDLRTFLDFAIDGAKRMDSLILDLLEYSRTGRRAGPFTAVPLGEVMAESLSNLMVAISDVGARVVVPDDLPAVLGDHAELVRLFQNLIGNAVKYRSPDRSPVVEIGCHDDGGAVEVWVRDNGIGMSPDNHQRAFQIFQRLVPHDAYEGTGIGLAICKKIVTSHDGRIWIESQLGQGCCFHVTLPKA